MNYYVRTIRSVPFKRVEIFFLRIKGVDGYQKFHNKRKDEVICSFFIYCLLTERNKILLRDISVSRNYVLRLIFLEIYWRKLQMICFFWNISIFHWLSYIFVVSEVILVIFAQEFICHLKMSILKQSPLEIFVDTRKTLIAIQKRWVSWKIISVG